VKGVSGLNRFVLGVLVFATLLFAGISPSSAHTSLVSSHPKVDERFSTPLAEISLQFDEDLITLAENEPNRITLTDAKGSVITLGKTDVAGSIARSSLDPAAMKPGIYTVHYRVVSGDGHVVSSQYQFTYLVGADSGVTQSSQSGESPASTESHISTPDKHSTSEKSAVRVITLHNHKSFIHRHSDHIVLALAAIAVIGSWYLIRRRND
jgi:methionine-rich copper-binding protein CopC